MAIFLKNRQDNSNKSNKTGTGAQAPRTAADAGFQNAVSVDAGDSGTAAGAIGELIAVFAAAIAQFEGADAKPFRVVSYRRTNQTSPVWNLRGRSEYLSGKL